MEIKKILDKITARLLIFLMAMMTVNVVWQVVSRYLLGAPSSWTEELARFLLIWLGLLGAAYVAGQKKHLAITLLPSKLTQKKRQGLERLIAVLIIIFALVAFVVGGASLVYITFDLEQNSAALGIPLGVVYAVVPLSGLLVVLYKILELREIGNQVSDTSKMSDTE